MIEKSKLKRIRQQIIASFMVVVFLLAILVSGCSHKDVSSDSSDKTKKEDIIEFKFAHCQNEGMPYSILAKKFIELVKEKSEGKIIGKEYPAMVLGAEREMAEGVQMGTIEIANITVAPLSNFAPQLQVLDLPFVFETPEDAHKKIDGPLGKKLTEILDNRGFKTLGFTESSGRHLTTNTKPVYKAGDLKGMKIRVMEIPLHIDTYTLLGSDPTVINFGELFTALQQGVVDGMDMPINLIWGQRFYEVQKYLMLTNHFYCHSVMLASPTFWEKLTPEQQQIFIEAAEEARLYQREQIKKLDAECLDNIKSKSSMEIISTDKIDIKSFREAVRPVYEKYEDVVGKDLLNLVLE